MKPKPCTDLEQSKELAEILPIESADMVLLHEEPYETSDSKFDGLHQALCVAFSQYDKSWRQKYRNISYFPCWSLAALLDYISANFRINIKYLDNYWELDCKVQATHAKELIDACVEMIIKLKDKKLL